MLLNIQAKKLMHKTETQLFCVSILYKCGTGIYIIESMNNDSYTFQDFRALVLCPSMYIEVSCNIYMFTYDSMLVTGFYFMACVKGIKVIKLQNINVQIDFHVCILTVELEMWCKCK
ncbi:hypothetical protein ACF0H5_017132 [Mactra antiquata]